MTIPPDERSPLAQGMMWASRITTISIEMVLPAVAGYWLDGWLGTRIVFLIVGVAIGMTAGIWQLVRMTASTSAAKRPKDEPPPGPPKE